MRLVRLTDLRQAQPQDITTGGLGLVIPDREDNGETTGVRIGADHYGANAPILHFAKNLNLECEVLGGNGAPSHSQKTM
jgi:hypothetical protein